MEHGTAVGTLLGLAGFDASSSSHGGLGTKMGTKDPSQALAEILKQVPGPCCGRVSTYNINIALISKSAPSACSESELLILVTRDFFLKPY